MKMKNTIILGELDYVLSASFENPTTKILASEYDEDTLPMNRNENGATNVNCLYVLNETLEQIQQMKLDMNGFIPETCYIAIPKKLHTLINRGAYKNWIKNDGVAKTGTIFDEREMAEWARFSTLYSGLFLDVTLRDVTYYEMSNPKHDIANMNRHKKAIKLMKTKINEHKENALLAVL